MRIVSQTTGSRIQIWSENLGFSGKAFGSIGESCDRVVCASRSVGAAAWWGWQNAPYSWLWPLGAVALAPLQSSVRLGWCIPHAESIQTAAARHGRRNSGQSVTRGVGPLLGMHSHVDFALRATAKVAFSSRWLEPFKVLPGNTKRIEKIYKCDLFTSIRFEILKISHLTFFLFSGGCPFDSDK